MMKSDKGSASITIKQVAEKAGVSTATVSRVLNDSPLVAEEAHGRVKRAIEELGYIPNPAARHLRAGHVRKIGVLFADISNPFFTSILTGIEGALQKAGYILILGNSNEDVHIEQLHLTAFLEEGVSGIIFAAVSNSKKRYLHILQAGIPLLTIDRIIDGLQVDSVTINNADAAYQATTHLLKLGHTRVAFISGPETMSTTQHRRMGYLQALQDAGNIHPFIEMGNYRQDGGYKAMQNLLDRPDRPSAVLVANNVMALGALQIIHERKLIIPSDIALVCFDDVPWFASLQPPLTVIAQPTFEMGAISARLLLDRIRLPDTPIQRLSLGTQLIIRSSCGAPSDGISRFRKIDTPVRFNLA